MKSRNQPLFDACDVRQVRLFREQRHPWASHAQHRGVRTWLERQSAFATCPFTEVGFIRVSLTPGFRASLADAQEALADITSRRQARFLAADLSALQLPSFTSHMDATDAYLIALAAKHRMRLATLDESLCAKSWAERVAVNPLRALRR